MDIGSALSSLTAAQTIAKGLREVQKAYDEAALKMQIADLISNIADAKIELVEAQAALDSKDDEIKRLTEALATKARLVEGPGGYRWQDRGDGRGIGLPVCPACLDKEGRQVVLVQSGTNFGAQCPRCSTSFDPVDRLLEPDPSGVQRTAIQSRAEARAEQRRQQNQTMRQLNASLNGDSWL